MWLSLPTNQQLLFFVCPPPLPPFLDDLLPMHLTIEVYLFVFCIKVIPPHRLHMRKSLYELVIFTTEAYFFLSILA